MNMRLLKHLAAGYIFAVRLVTMIYVPVIAIALLSGRLRFLLLALVLCSGGKSLVSFAIL